VLKMDHLREVETGLRLWRRESPPSCLSVVYEGPSSNKLCDWAPFCSSETMSRVGEGDESLISKARREHAVIYPIGKRASFIFTLDELVWYWRWMEGL
jgi:hypothetical protein